MALDNTYIRFDWAMKHMLRDKSKGRAEGIAEGLARGLSGVAAKMIALGMDTATICAATGLTEQQVDNMRS